MPLRILIVDDDVKMAERIQARLIQKGFEADCAADGQEGLEKFQREYDAVILDIVMPSVDGMELLSSIRSVSQIVPVIILTDYASKETAVEAIHQHVFDYVEKPISDWEGFLDTVERAAHTKDPVAAAIEEWVNQLSPQERQRPLIFEGQNSYSPRQLLEEVRKNTEFGQRQRMNIGKQLADVNLEKIR